MYSIISLKSQSRILHIVSSVFVETDMPAFKRLTVLLPTDIAAVIGKFTEFRLT